MSEPYENYVQYFIPEWVFNSLMLMPDEQTRITFVTDLYAEQYEQLEKAMDSKSSRPWAK